MGVYINGMEMPKNPGAYSMKIRLFVKEDGTASVWGLKEYIPHEPLDVIPVPPHGRLIDGDKLNDYLKTAAIMADGEAKDAYIDARAEAKTMPTIIPADQPKEGA